MAKDKLDKLKNYSEGKKINSSIHSFKKAGANPLYDKQRVE